MSADFDENNLTRGPNVGKFEPDDVYKFTGNKNIPEVRLKNHAVISPHLACYWVLVEICVIQMKTMVYLMGHVRQVCFRNKYKKNTKIKLYFIGLVCWAVKPGESHNLLVK